MPDLQRTLKIPCRRFVFFPGCFIASVIIFSMFLHIKINGFKGAMFGETIYGTAPKPWVYRAFVPFCVRTAVSVIPKETRNSINNYIWEIKAFKNANKRLDWEKSMLTEYTIACLFMYLFLCCFFFSFRYLFTGIYKAPTGLLDGTSLLALLGLPVMFRFYSYIYDFATLFFFTLCLGLMARKKWLPFTIAYTFSCWNKETTILLTILFAIYFGYCAVSRLEKSLFVRLFLLQISIYTGVRIILFLIFHHNPGKFLYYTLLSHNLSMYPYSIGTASGFLFITLMILYKWAEKPLFLKCGLLMLVPLMVLCLFFGWLNEFRDYYEVYPVIILLVAHSVGDILQWKAVPRMDLPAQG